MSLSSVIRYVEVKDSAATDGSGLVGKAFGDFTAKYLVQGGTLTSLTTETITTLGTYQAPTSAAHIRIKELNSAAPTKGIYEVHFHDTQVANTGKKLWLFLSVTGGVPVRFEMDLIPYAGGNATNSDNLDSAASNYSATRGLAGTALPAVASGSSNSLARSSDGSAITVSTGLVAVPDTQKVDVNTIKTQTVTLSGGVTIPAATLASTTNITAGTITTTTNLTNAPPDSAGVTTLLSRIPSALFSGITSLAQWLGLIAGKQVGDTTARTELRATGAGSGTYDETTDSGEAIRDRGDAAWLTATGFSTLDAAGVRNAVGLATNNLDTQLLTLQTDIDDLQTRTPAALSAGGFMMSDVEEVLGTAAQPTGITIRKNVALANFEFPMFDAADGKTLLSGLTITATMSLDGGAFAAMTNAASEVGTSGVYKINLAAADTNADTVTYKFDGGVTANVTIISFTTQP